MTIGFRMFSWNTSRFRFTRLLAALCLLLFSAPLIGSLVSDSGRTMAILLVTGLLAAVLIASAIAVSERPHQLRVSLFLAITCVTLTAVAGLTDSSTLRIIQNIFAIGFLLHVVQLLLRALFRTHQVDYDTIAASLCGYLSIGLVFAIAFSLLTEVDNDALSIPAPAKQEEPALRFGDQNTATTLYFSFVTLTTLGYGDITPVSKFARMLTVAEALIGQIYLVVLVARLVGLHISHELLKRTDDGEA